MPPAIPTIPYLIPCLIMVFIEAPLASVLRRGHRAINIHWPRVDLASLTPETARHYSCWTLDDEKVIAAFLRAGVLNITTRMPRRALALRKEIQG